MKNFHLTPAEVTFIQQNEHKNVQTLLLRHSSTAGLDLKKIAIQLTARQKLQSKLPSWVALPSVVFPSTVPTEQASSELTARYKARLIAKISPVIRHLLDGTGGMGVDTWAFAEVAQHVTYVERDKDLADLASFNLPLLRATNVTVVNGQTEQQLAHTVAPFDWIYLDPARRDERGGRVVGLENCEPNVIAWLPALQAKTTWLLVKASPLIDLSATFRQLPGIRAVHVVAVKHEVKEVLLVIGPGEYPPDAVQLTAADLSLDLETTLTFRKGDEQAAVVAFGSPQTYLYEPNAAILKAGAFRLVAHRFGLTKLAANSHLYTADSLIPDFPGRAFRLMGMCKPSREELQTFVPSLKANLTVRNFPQSVEDLRKKLRLKEGGDQYVFATTLHNGDKRLLISVKP